MDIYNFPLLLLKKLEKLYIDLRKFVDENSDFIKIANDAPLNFQIQGNDPRLIFFILNAGLTIESKLSIEINFYPKSEAKAEVASSIISEEHLFNILNMWLIYVKGYSRINLTNEQQKIKQYEDEFYEDLEILDDEANIKAFKLPQQIFINKYLEHVQKVLEKEESETTKDFTELKEEVQDLRDKLPILSMNKTMKGLSKILAKARKSGISIISKIWDDALKEVIKSGVKYGLEHHELLIQKLTHFFV